MEGKEWVWDNGVVKERNIEEWKSFIEQSTRIALAEKKAEVFKNFLKKL